MEKSNYQYLKNKRLAAIDFGLKRIGLAVCDPMHITVSTRPTLDYTSNDFWTELLLFLNNEKIEAIVVGAPYNFNNKSSNILSKVMEFVKELKEKTTLEILLYDESYSSKKASSVMLEIGMKKKQRQKKGNADKIAAAVILREFLNEII